MPFLGTTPKQGFTSHVAPQSFSSSANGSTTIFTLNRAVASENDLEVFVGNVRQEPGSGKSYTASGTTLTFDVAPPAGSNVYVNYKGQAQITTTPLDASISTQKLVDNAVTNAKIGDMAASKLTGAMPALDGSALTGAGNWKHIKTQVADNHSSVDFMHGTNGVIFDSTYDVYEFIIHYWYGASVTELEVLPSTNGSTYTKTGTVGMLHGVYRSSNSNTPYHIDYGGGPNGGSGSLPQGFMRSPINCGDSKGELTAGTLRVYYPHDNQYTTLAVGQLGLVQGPYDAGFANLMAISNSMCSTSVAATTHGVQFKASSGNCYAKISLYGIKDS